ncbi:FMN-binding protein [Actinoplanes sp. NPDC020271]|uniref:FMN-binding protein n=1 Tax=Actinoplanes sp. NPDC020271 TaxID=3363896 RepID=UPI00378ED40F
MTMRRITLYVMSTVAALVLLFSYRTSSGATLPGAGTAAAAPGVVPDTATAVPSAGTPSKGHRATTVNGTVAQTRWGPVQVQVTIVGRKITDVRALQHPTGSARDDRINTDALPRLREQVLTAQSARIDGVTGATVTSGGYRRSLQAALDAAHFG